MLHKIVIFVYIYYGRLNEVKKLLWFLPHDQRIYPCFIKVHSVDKKGKKKKSTYKWDYALTCRKECSMYSPWSSSFFLLKRFRIENKCNIFQLRKIHIIWLIYYLCYISLIYSICFDFMDYISFGSCLNVFLSFLKVQQEIWKISFVSIFLKIIFASKAYSLIQCCLRFSY